jgi:hypothetical protein
MSKKAQDQDVVQTNSTPAEQTPVLLQAEEIEPVIAPRLAANHNESVLVTRLAAEELEAVIAPRLAANHNETVLE